MHVYEAHGYAGDFLGWRSEVAARIRDFFARKAIPASEKLVEGIAGLVHRLENAVPSFRLKAAVKDLLHALRREDPRAVDALEWELEEFFTSIRSYRQRESIENYSAFLFPVEVQL
jgi:hypothetical protein